MALVPQVVDCGEDPGDSSRRYSRRTAAFGSLCFGSRRGSAGAPAFWSAGECPIHENYKAAVLKAGG